MPCDDAGTVHVTLRRNGVLKSIHDKKEKRITPCWIRKDPRTGADPAIDGEHFEWSLSKYLETGVPITSLYTAYAHMAPNDPDRADLNTVKIELPKLVKLDCGLWAAQKLGREYQGDEGPQREFGFIEKGNAWLAEYVPRRRSSPEKLNEIAQATWRELVDKEASLAAMLARIVAEPGEGAIRLKTRAKIGTAHAQLDTWMGLYVCLPDLHLPGKPPDVPPVEQRYGGREPTDDEVKARLKLQSLLRDCQSQSGLLRGRKSSKRQARRIQDHLEQLKDWQAAGRAGLPPRFNLETRQARTGALQKMRLKKPVSVPHSLLPDEFLAEKAIVDRVLELHCSWFYAPGSRYVERGLHARNPQFGKEDWYRNLHECLVGDPATAFDLIHVLAAVWCLQRKLELNPQQVLQEPADWQRELTKLIEEHEPRHVRVRQLGDLHELWRNHEFLYHGFWVRQTGAGSKGARGAIRGGTRWAGKNLDDYQYRKEEFYYDTRPDAGEKQIPGFGLCRRRLARFYAFNHMPTEEMYYRHVVGDMVREEYVGAPGDAHMEDVFRLPDGELGRRRRLLRERIDAAREFSLPLLDPEPVTQSILGLLGKTNAEEKKDNYLAALYRANLGGLLHREQPSIPVRGEKAISLSCYILRAGPAPRDKAPSLPGAGAYVRRNHFGQDEVKWSRLLLDMLQVVGCRDVYGNHDGYRGDPLLNSELDPQDQAPGWISEPGIWFEHAHRWDQYNRDGCAFGAGATNLGYYYRTTLDGLDTTGGRMRKAEPVLSKQEQKCYQAGAALWYLVTHFKGRLGWFIDQENIRNGVHPFDVYVCGHTHGGSLIEICFSLEQSARHEMTKTGKSEKIKSPRMSRDRVTAKRYAFEQRAEFDRHTAAEGSVVRLPWLKRPEPKV